MRKAMILGAFAALLTVTGCNEKKEASKDVVSFDEVLTTRRSIRSFFQGNQTNEVGDGWGAYDNGLSNCYLILKARAMGLPRTLESPNTS